MGNTIYGENKLTSLDYAHLIQYAAQKFHRVFLNKTQVNKILFYVYGVYLAEKGTTLFEEGPQAWIYGPVFPSVYHDIDTSQFIPSFTPEKAEEFKQDQDALQIVKDAVDFMYDKSAVSLTNWSHSQGSPWYNTIYKLDDNGKINGQNQWGTPIDDSLIKEYFSKDENRIRS